MGPEETSDRIKRAALALFVEVGYGSATVDEIAANAGVGVASIYRRWPDKAALANELVADYVAAVDGTLTPLPGGTRKSRFLTLWNRLWESAQADPDILLFFEAQAHAGFMTEEVAAIKEAAGMRWITTIPEFGIGADPATASALMIGTLTAVLRAGVEVDPDELGERLWLAVRSA